MARRVRGGAAPNGNGHATNGVEPGDEPGARTMGAIALQRWVARGPGEDTGRGEPGEQLPTQGPYDEEDLDLERAGFGLVDFGAVRVPVPRGGEVTVEPEEGRLQAVHVMLPAGRLSVSALAAPRSARLWPDLAAEIDESLREGGATVRSFTGDWGRELHARTGQASSVFVGVDGPRWMLYGVATGPAGSAAELDSALRRMLRGTVVVRGRLPYPVRTVLPLTVPEQLAASPEAGPGTQTIGERVPAARSGGPSAPRNGRPPTGRRVPTRPAAPAGPRPSTADEPTVPHGIPRVTPGPVTDGRIRINGTNGVPGPGDAVPPTGRGPRNGAAGPARNGVTGPARNGGGPRPSEVEPPLTRTGQRRVADLVAAAEPSVTQTGQRRVAELLAAAERDRSARAAEQERAERAAEQERAARAERERAERIARAAEQERAERAARAERERAEQAARAAEQEQAERAERERAERAARAAEQERTERARRAAEQERAVWAERAARQERAEQAARAAERAEQAARAAERDRAARERPASGAVYRSGNPAPPAADALSWRDADRVVPPHDDIALLRLGDPPRVREPERDDAGMRAATPWPSADRRPADGSEDWTVPMRIVPPRPEKAPASQVGPPAADPFADAPWVAEARRVARAAQAAERAAEQRAREEAARQREAREREARERDARERDAREREARWASRDRPARPDGAAPEHAGHHRPAHRRPDHGGGRPATDPRADLPVRRDNRSVPPSRHRAAYPVDDPADGRHHRPDR